MSYTEACEWLEGAEKTLAGAKVVVLTDELRLQREYHEVKRKAAVGERINIVNKCYFEKRYKNGDTFEVLRDVWGGDVFVALNPNVCVMSKEYVVLEPSDIVIIDGDRYTLVERKANVGERVVIVNNEFPSNYDIGEVFTVDDSCEETASSYAGVYADALKRRRNANIIGFVRDGKYRVIVPVEASANAAKPVDHSAIIDGLTDTCVKLTLRVTELERQFAAKNIVDGLREDTILIAQERRPKSLTRDDIVDLAKKDVAELERKVNDGKYVISGGNRFVNVKFSVNRDKRTVVAVLVGPRSGRVWARGKARCAPDDCFNVHIGKAVALRRALGLDIPEYYLRLPQPAEVRVGDVVIMPDGRHYTCMYNHNAGTFSERIIDDSRDEIGGER